MILYKPLQMLIIEVPKTGTESLENAFTILGSTVIQNFHPTLQECVDFKFITTPLEQYTIFATIRNPFEKLLSLYLYRARQLNKTVSVTDFRHQVELGKGKIKDHPWQMRFQHEFLLYNNKSYGAWWCFDHLVGNFNKLQLGISLPHINRSSNYKTSELVNKFYDNKTKDLVYETWYQDFVIYDKVKHDQQT